MNWKQEFLASLDGTIGFEKDAFIEAHQAPPPVSIRLNPSKAIDPTDVFAATGIQGKVPWCSEGYYLQCRPVFTLEPLLHAGAFYVQEASSMFLHHALETVLKGRNGLHAVDLCAAPGGKTTLLASLPYFDVILANEIIQSRVGVLSENLVKWGSNHVLVSNNDPEEVAQLGEQFDLVLVDAPCSGSGLFRKDEAAMNEWSTDAVALCAGRQKRILHHAMSLVKEGGFLLYSTCSFSTIENEANADVIIDSGLFQSSRLSVPPEWGIVETLSEKHQAYGYRFYPHKVAGEGFFTALFQKTSGSVNEEKEFAAKLIPEAKIGLSWLSAEQQPISFHMKGNDLFFLQEKTLQCLREWASVLRIRKSGVKMGTVIRGELIPDHELALSPLLKKDISVIDLNKEEAIRYLRRDDVDGRDFKNGWYIVRTEGLPLGWAKMVNGRLKNHYPLSWRILMSPI